MPLAPRYTWRRNRWPAYFWRGVVIAILVLLVAADLSPRPVLFTSELSFEVVSQMEEAGEVCRGDRDSKGSSCAVEVWKACHMAKLELANSHEMPTRGMDRAAVSLCDTGVIADAGELGAALALRYGDKYLRKGFYRITETRGNDTFLAFHKLYNHASNFKIGSNYMSDETIMKLRTLLVSVFDFSKPYQIYVENSPSGRDFWPDGINHWGESFSFVDIQGILERNCSTARIAVRERRLGWDELLDSCLHLADACEKISDRLSASCSVAKETAEFESMWQKLPEICAMLYERVEETIGDACHQAALDICEYKLVAPEDEWIGQFISMREFACTAASRTPDLRFVQMARG